MSPDIEVPLSGGHITTAVRIGDTVRRPARPWTATVHALLHHLERQRFEGSPRSLGIDDKGREILSYLEGEVGSGVAPDYVWRTDALLGVARLLRDYHDATTSFTPPPDATWQWESATPTTHEVICHNDIAPWNTVFSGQTPKAFIDWDLAAPGTREWDIAYALWQFVPIHDPDQNRNPDARDAHSIARRITEFCDAYGVTERADLLSTIRERQMASYTGIRDLAIKGDPPYLRLWEEGAGSGILRQVEFLDSIRSDVERSL